MTPGRDDTALRSRADSVSSLLERLKRAPLREKAIFGSAAAEALRSRKREDAFLNRDKSKSTMPLTGMKAIAIETDRKAASRDDKRDKLLSDNTKAVKANRITTTVFDI